MKKKIAQILLGAVGSILAALVNHYAGNPIGASEFTVAAGALLPALTRG